MKPSGLVTSPSFLRHDTGPGHPERPERLVAVLERLRASGLERHLERAEAIESELGSIARAHDAKHVRAVERAIQGGARVLDEGDTRVSADSFRAARAAAGGAVMAVDRVLDGAWRNAFLACRPPGHHAERDASSGFCVFNNAAIAALHALEARQLRRVAIVDWDVHHGNGTQHIFESDARVFYASLHQWPLYPGTGLANERGIGPGAGTTLNLPQPPRAGDADWLGAFEDALLPALDAFRPELVIVSAGFDAHARDPLAETRLTTDAFARMTRLLLQLADERARGRLVSLLEGGYDLDALAESVEAHVGALVESGA